MTQTAGVLSFLDRPWALEDVISMPYDSESEPDSDAEAMGQDVVDMARNQSLDDSLPSISAIMASAADVRLRPKEAIGEQFGKPNLKYGNG
jgi:hypothetical protein